MVVATPQRVCDDFVNKLRTSTGRVRTGLRSGVVVVVVIAGLFGSFSTKSLSMD